MSIDVPTLLSAASLTLITIGWLHYLALIPKEKVPARPLLSIVGMSVGILTVIGAFVWGTLTQHPPTLWAWLPGVIAILLAAFFFYLLGQAPLPDRPIKLAIGDPLPPLVAQGADATQHDAQDWIGQRVLFKFFRGHW